MLKLTNEYMVSVLLEDNSALCGLLQNAHNCALEAFNLSWKGFKIIHERVERCHLIEQRDDVFISLFLLLVGLLLVSKASCYAAKKDAPCTLS